VSQLAFSPDGKKIVANGVDKVTIWDVETGARIAVMDGLSTSVNRLSFSPDGSTIAAASTSEVRVWDALNGREKKRFAYTPAEIQWLAFIPSQDAPRKNILLVVIRSNGADNTQKAIRTLHYNTATWQPAPNRVPPLPYTPGHMVVSRDGEKLWATDALTAAKVRRWDIASGNQEASTAIALDEPQSMVLSPDEGQIAIRYSQNTEHEKKINGIAILSTDDMTLHTLRQPEPQRTMGRAPPQSRAGYTSVATPLISEVAFGSNGKLYAGQDEKSYDTRSAKLLRWDIATRQELPPFEVQATSWYLSNLIFQGDSFLFGRGIGSPLTRWSLKTGQFESLAVRPQETSFTISSDGKLLVTNEIYGRTVSLLDVATGVTIRQFTPEYGRIWEAQLSPDNRWLATASTLSETTGEGEAAKTTYLQKVVLWDAATGARLDTFDLGERFAARLTLFKFSPDSKHLVALRDKTSQVWSVTAGKLVPVRPLLGEFEMSTLAAHFAFSPDGRLLASSHAKSIVLWDINTGAQRRIAAPSPGTLAFSPDGRILAASMGRTVVERVTFEGVSIQCWDLTSGRELRTLPGHDTGTVTLDFSPSGNTLISRSSGEIKFWNADTGALHATISFITPRSSGSRHDWLYETSRRPDSTERIWVVYTPNGHFDASAEAMQHLYWRIGTQTHDLAQFQAQFHQPGLLGQLVADL
jgi:WD40 repeat protein